MTLALQAMQFAMLAHAGQRRKYTGNPYTEHLAQVAGIVATLPHAYYHPQAMWQEMIATAWLHDVIEDCGVHQVSLRANFGPVVAGGVLLLSDLEKEGNRAACARLADAPCWVQTVKIADLISNTASIREHDPKFAEAYIPEARALLEALDGAHPTLRNILREVLK